MDLHLKKCVDISKQIELLLRFDTKIFSSFTHLDGDLIVFVTVYQNNEGELDLFLRFCYFFEVGWLKK